MQSPINDFLKQSALDIISLLQHPPSPTIPSLEAGDNVKNAIFIVASLLNRTNNTLDKIEQARKQLHQSYALPTPAHNTPQFSLPLTPSLPRVLPANHHQFLFPSVKNKLPFNPAYPLPRVPPTLYPPRPVTPDIHLAAHVFDAAGKKQTLENLLKGQQKQIWQQSASNEFARLAQGNDSGTVGTDTIEFISHSEIPSQAKVTYASFVCDYKPFKTEKHRVRMVVGGDRLNYAEDAGAPAASLLETKLLVNSVISDSPKGARFFTCDLKDFYLATPMEHPEYMKIPLSSVPDDITNKYNLQQLKTPTNHICIKIKKGMYGLKQAAVLAYNHLVRNLSKHGYAPIPHTVGLWKHKTRRITFCLCVDDFGIKYYDKQDAQHLLDALHKYYKTSVDWSGKQFCGLHLHWNYNDRWVDMTMPTYIPSLLHKLNHQPNLPQYSPYPATPFQIARPGSRQYAPPPDSSPALNKATTTKVQSIIRSLLYYARAIDCTMLPALNALSRQQSSPTQKTLQLCHRLLDYAATYPAPRLRFHASDMILTIHSDAAYLVEPQARSRVAGHFTLGTAQQSIQPPPILVECKTLRHVVASSVEAEVAGVFHNAQIALNLRHLLISLGHPQPQTHIISDNTTATSFANSNLTQKRSKSWDMRFYWLRDKQCSKAFKIVWKKSEDNLADYFTKNFSANYHRHIRSKYLLDSDALSTARVC